MKKIRLSVLTPEKVMINDLEVDSVTLPAYNGEMGILPDHIPYVAQIKEGLLKYKRNGIEEYISIFWGFCYIKNNEVTVLTEIGELAKELDEEKARQEFQKAKEAIHMKKPDLDIEAAQASLKKAIVRLKLAELKKNNYKK